jgi:hypothetical protein
MRQHRLGKLLLLGLELLLPSCRDSIPPKIEICIGDGFGGADCVEADGTQLYKPPSGLKNYWMSNQPDMANFTSWCYQTAPSTVMAGMNGVERTIHAR